ncbi:MAG: hypothetical protein OHK0053_30050 [Microscillaceae bacterium]
MLKYPFCILLLTLVLSTSATMAQEIDVPEDYISEFIYGININTNGGLIGGIMFKTTKIIKPKWYRSLGIELVSVKNPKETRFTSPQTGNNFVYGKRNYFFSIRPQYGRDIILFRKAPDEGVQISANLAAGPSLGLQIPYNINYQFPGGIIRTEQYEPSRHPDIFQILGSTTFLDGLGQTNFILGAHIKAGISLDFGAFRNSITGLELGFMMEAFTQKPEILVSPNPSDPPAPNAQVFTAAYANFFFGSRK